MLHLYVTLAAVPLLLPPEQELPMEACTPVPELLNP